MGDGEIFCRREALKSAVRAICRFSWRIGKFKVFTVLKSCMENYGERGATQAVGKRREPTLDFVQSRERKTGKPWSRVEFIQ